MIPENRLDWENVKTVAEVARRGTVRAAAETLGVHHSTISRRIESLEAMIGTRLFDRLPDGYVLTAAGEEIVEVAYGFADKLVEAERQIVGQDRGMTGRIKVTMMEPIAVNIFMPRLKEFITKYPALELDLLSTYETLNMARREADVAIRFSNSPSETLVGKRLFPFYQAAYASPDYLAEHDLINQPEKAQWLGWGEVNSMVSKWIIGTPYENIPVWGNFPNLPVQLAGAIHGLGLSLLPCAVADPEPGLMRIDNRPPTQATDIWVLTHADLRRTARVRAFMEFAEEVLRSERKAFAGEI